jgi:hypothetical protein
MPARLPILPLMLPRICILTKSQLVEVRLRVPVQNVVHALATDVLLELFWLASVKGRTLATHLLHAPHGVSIQ